MERYDTFWPRFGAGFVDGLVLGPIRWADSFVDTPGRSRSAMIIWLVFSLSAPWIYNILMHAKFGQTVGKMATHVKVMDVSEERLPTLQQAYLRDIGGVLGAVFGMAYFVHLVVIGAYSADIRTEGPAWEIASYVGFGWLALELFTMWTNDKRRALHDYIAGTVVVRVK